MRFFKPYQDFKMSRAYPLLKRTGAKVEKLDLKRISLAKPAYIDNIGSF